MTERFTPFSGFRSMPLSPVQAGYIGGKMRVLCGDYTADNLPAGSTITLGWLPEGGIVLDALVWHDALGVGSHITLGDDEQGSRYIAPITSATAGKKLLDQPQGFLYRAPKRRCIRIGVSGAAIAGTIKAALIYSLE